MIAVFDHPWLGGLFGDTQAAALWAPAAQLAHMRAFEAAYALGLGHAGVVEMDVAKAAADAINAAELDMLDLRHGTAADGVVVPALIRQLKTAAGPAGLAVHRGATSQDVIDTAMVLCALATTDLLISRLSGLEAELRKLTARFGDATLMGRTRMQAALVMRVADRLASWALPLSAHKDWLAALRPRLGQVQFGGAVGDRAALGAAAPAVAAHLAAALDLAEPGHGWHTMRATIVEFAGILALISGTMGKIGQDIALMAQQGLDEIAVAAGGGSSAMPHKQNPVLAELLVTLARFNATQISAMQQAMIHEQERSGAAWALEWMVLPQMAVSAARSLSAGAEIVSNITRIGAPD